MPHHARHMAKVLPLLLMGCQSEADALAAYCAVHERCTACVEGSAVERQQALEEFLTQNVRNRSARELILSSQADPSRRGGEAISQRVRELGIASCPALETIEVQLSEPITLPNTEASSSP